MCCKCSIFGLKMFSNIFNFQSEQRGLYQQIYNWTKTLINLLTIRLIGNCLMVEVQCYLYFQFWVTDHTLTIKFTVLPDPTYIYGCKKYFIGINGFKLSSSPSLYLVPKSPYNCQQQSPPNSNIFHVRTSQLCVTAVCCALRALLS